MVQQLFILVEHICKETLQGNYIMQANNVWCNAGHKDLATRTYDAIGFHNFCLVRWYSYKHMFKNVNFLHPFILLHHAHMWNKCYKKHLLQHVFYVILFHMCVWLYTQVIVLSNCTVYTYNKCRLKHSRLNMSNELFTFEHRASPV